MDSGGTVYGGLTRCIEIPISIPPPRIPNPMDAGRAKGFACLWVREGIRAPAYRERERILVQRERILVQRERILVRAKPDVWKVVIAPPPRNEVGHPVDVRKVTAVSRFLSRYHPLWDSHPMNAGRAKGFACLWVREGIRAPAYRERERILVRARVSSLPRIRRCGPPGLIRQRRTKARSAKARLRLGELAVASLTVRQSGTRRGDPNSLTAFSPRGLSCGPSAAI